MKLALFIPVFILFLGCEVNNIDGDEDTIIPENPKEENQSAKGKITHVGNIKMNEGPHDLLIDGNKLYAVRDHQIFQFGIQNPAIPTQQSHFSNQNSGLKFGKLYVIENRLFVPCLGDGFLYEFDASLNLTKKHELSIASFKPNSIIRDTQGKYWVGGSNGSKGILAKYTMSGSGVLSLEAHFVMSGNESNLESIVEYGDYILASIAKGDLVSFKKSDAKQVSEVTFVNESEHEKWGYTVISKGNTLYWANWGAGFATVDVSDPTKMKVTKVLTHSGFKSQFKDAEGTNVYDIVYNSKHDLLCLANGWSGVVLIKPSSSDIVYDYIDPQYFQNRCIETSGDYVYTGNISGGMSGDMKGIKIFKITN